MSKEDLFKKMAQSIVDGDAEVAEALAKEAGEEENDDCNLRSAVDREDIPESI